MERLVLWSAVSFVLLACSSERAVYSRSRASYAGASGALTTGVARADRAGAAGTLESGGAGAEQASAAGTLRAGTGWGGASAGAAGSSMPAETSCRDGVDDDGDGRTDCADPDCAAACARSCESVPELAGPGVLGSLTDQPDDFDLSCGSGGPELVYVYRAKRDGELGLRLSSDADLRIGIRSGCGSGKQLACDEARVSVPVETGKDVFVVVEGVGSEDRDPTFALSIVGCGDGVLDPGEQCDDGGRVSGDGCSKTCQLESSEGQDNGTLAGADELSGERYVGSIEDSGDVDLIHLAVDSRQTKILVTSSGFGAGCSSRADTKLELLSSDGEPVAANEAEPTVGTCAALAVSGLAPGDYYLRVASSSESSFAYMLNVTLATCGNAVREAGELCDDGNTEEGDGCGSDCMPD